MITGNFPAPFSLNNRFTFLRIQTWPSTLFSLRETMSHLADYLGTKGVGPPLMEIKTVCTFGY